MSEQDTEESRAYFTIERSANGETKVTTEGFNTAELIGLFDALRQKYVDQILRGTSIQQTNE